MGKILNMYCMGARNLWEIACAIGPLVLAVAVIAMLMTNWLSLDQIIENKVREVLVEEGIVRTTEANGSGGP